MTIDRPDVWQTLGADGRPVLLLDFDGTVCVGDGPVWAYADAVLAALGPDAPAGFADQVRRALAAYFDGAPDAPRYLDGYAAVVALTAEVVSDEQRSAAFMASRSTLADHQVSAPPGLAALLTDLDGQVWRVLVTNAPAAGVAQTLATLGVRCDVVVSSAGKPAGWAALLPHLLAHRPASSLLTVGDIGINDLAEPMAAGAAGCLIDRFDHRSCPANATAPNFPALYPAVREWAADPAGFVLRHPVQNPDDTR